jgi:hypothetical protein
LFFFLFVFLCCFVSVRSVHQAIHAELDSLRIEREAYNMRVGKDKRRLYTLHRPTRELREREREGRQDTFGRDYITSGWWGWREREGELWQGASPPWWETLVSSNPHSSLPAQFCHTQHGTAILVHKDSKETHMKEKKEKPPPPPPPSTLTTSSFLFFSFIYYCPIHWMGIWDGVPFFFYSWAFLFSFYLFFATSSCLYCTKHTNVRYNGTYRERSQQGLFNNTLALVRAKVGPKVKMKTCSFFLPPCEPGFSHPRSKNESRNQK